MAALTRAKLVEQVRVLVGDAFPGSPRYTDEQIHRALQWAQTQCCSKLGLSYVEVPLAVISKLVMTPPDALHVQHVRIGELLVPTWFTLQFVLFVEGQMFYVGGSIEVPDVPSQWDLQLLVTRDPGFEETILVSPYTGAPDANMDPSFNGTTGYTQGDPIVSLPFTGPLQHYIPCYAESYGSLGGSVVTLGLSVEAESSRPPEEISISFYSENP